MAFSHPIFRVIRVPDSENAPTPLSRAGKPLQPSFAETLLFLAIGKVVD